MWSPACRRQTSARPSDSGSVLAALSFLRRDLDRSARRGSHPRWPNRLLPIEIWEKARPDAETSQRPPMQTQALRGARTPAKADKWEGQDFVRQSRSFRGYSQCLNTAEMTADSYRLIGRSNRLILATRFSAYLARNGAERSRREPKGEEQRWDTKAAGPGDDRTRRRRNKETAGLGDGMQMGHS